MAEERCRIKIYKTIPIVAWPSGFRIVISAEDTKRCIKRKLELVREVIEFFREEEGWELVDHEDERYRKGREFLLMRNDDYEVYFEFRPLFSERKVMTVIWVPDFIDTKDKKTIDDILKSIEEGLTSVRAMMNRLYRLLKEKAEIDVDVKKYFFGRFLQ